MNDGSQQRKKNERLDGSVSGNLDTNSDVFLLGLVKM